MTMREVLSSNLPRSINNLMRRPGTGKAPAIFGMNFQAVSVGEKLVAGGYDATLAPKPILQHAIAHTDASIGRMVAELKAKGLYSDTLIIVSAKHGQSPINFAKLQMEPKATQAPDHTVVDPGDVINAPVDQKLSQFVNPNSGSQYAQSGHLQTDDVGIVCFSPTAPPTWRRPSRASSSTRPRSMPRSCRPERSSGRTSPRVARWRRSTVIRPCRGRLLRPGSGHLHPARRGRDLL